MKKVLFSFLVITIVLTSCKNYDDEFDALNASVAALQSQVSSISTLQSNLSAIQNTVNSLQTTLEGTGVDLSGVLTNITSLQTDLNALITDFSDADLAAVQETLAALQADVDDLLQFYFVAPVLLKTFEISLSPLYSVPANTGRNETGMAILTLFDSGELGVDITINNLSSSDVLTASHIHSGDLVSNGGVLITLVDFQNISFVNNRATGVVLLSTQQFAEIQESDLYVNVHSQEKPSGLIRGSVDKVIDFAMDVTLKTDYEIPAVTGRNETGIAHLRLTSDSELYFSLTVNDLSPTDMLTASHIHLGDLGIQWWCI